MKAFLMGLAVVFLSGCSIVGKSNAETVPYTLITAADNEQIEIRNYEHMVLVSANMGSNGRNDAFRALFRYISGENEGRAEIAMTAPVMMESENLPAEGSEIPMTAPVFMERGEERAQMSFVMPAEFTLATTPKPTNPNLQVSELRDHKVAAIRFNGRLTESNVAKHTEMLLTWMSENGYVAVGEPVEAGYNGPFTLPMFRRNEVLIEIE